MVTHTNNGPPPAVNHSPGHEDSMTGLVSGIMEDVEHLAEQQFALLRQETKEEVRKAIAAVKHIAVGAVLGIIAGIALMTAMSLGLSAAIANLPLWGAFAIVGSILAILSGALIMSGRTKASSVHAIPLTLQSTKENLQCLTPTRK